MASRSRSMESTVLLASTDDSDEDYIPEGDIEEGGETAASDRARGSRQRQPSAARGSRPPKKDKKKGKGKSDEDDSSDEGSQRNTRKEGDDGVERRDRGEELVRRRMRQRKKEKKVGCSLSSGSITLSSPLSLFSGIQTIYEWAGGHSVAGSATIHFHMISLYAPALRDTQSEPG
jgi:hypothetical protein